MLGTFQSFKLLPTVLTTLVKPRGHVFKVTPKGGDAKHPHQKGSWNPANDPHGGAWGRVGQTALSVLTLEVYYRHLPLYRRDLGTVKTDTK